MHDYLIDGQWLMGKIAGVLAELKKLKKMRKDGKKKDDEGLSLYFQILELRIERNLLKEVLEHAIDAERKEGEKG